MHRAYFVLSCVFWHLKHFHSRADASPVPAVTSATVCATPTADPAAGDAAPPLVGVAASACCSTAAAARRLAAVGGSCKKRFLAFRHVSMLEPSKHPALKRLVVRWRREEKKNADGDYDASLVNITTSMLEEKRCPCMIMRLFIHTPCASMGKKEGAALIGTGLL